MFKFVQHVNYVVTSLDEFLDYMEKNFGMKPTQLQDRERWRGARYQLGQTELRVRQPIPNVDSDQARFLAKNGPGLEHLAWAVENVPQVAQELQAKGVVLKRDAFQDPDGYPSVDIDPDNLLGFGFELESAEERTLGPIEGGENP